MTNDVIFMAEQVGAEYRGLVLDAKTFKPVFITAHNYFTETIAKCAARRAYAERVPEEIQKLLPSMSILEG